jgi:hypothetical protein
MMAFQDRYKRKFLAFYSYLLDSYPKLKRANRKDQGQRKQTEFIIRGKMTVTREREREKEKIIRPEKKYKRCHIDQHHCLSSLFIYHCLRKK